jgi:hypothetical protein
VASAPLIPHPPNPAASVPQTSPNLVHFDPKQVVPTQNAYFQRNDELVFQFLTNAVGITAAVFYRWLTPDGEIKEGELDTPPFTSSVVLPVPLYEGWLISFGARITGGLPIGGWCFLQVFMSRQVPPTASINRPHAVIWSGFINAAGFNGWPGGPAKESTDGMGMLRSITGTVPAVGADINEVVPAQRRWVLLAIRAQLTASAAVANREVVWQIDDGANIFFKGITTLNQTAGQVIQYSGFNTAPTPAQVTGDTFLLLPLPLALKNSFRIKTQTTNLQVGDQWTAPQYVVSEWGTWDNI